MYTLESGTAKAVISETGGQVISWSVDGQDIIFPQIQLGAKKRGGVPICFPFFGPPTKRFADIPQHGWLRKQELKVKLLPVWKSYIELLGFSQKRPSYPWSMKYIVKAHLTDKGLELELRIERQYDGIEEDAPVNPCFHPYFSSFGKRLVKIGGKVYDFETLRNGRSEKIHVGENPRILIDTGDRKIHMLLTSHFSKKTCLTLWTDNEKYFCVEPSLTSIDEFDTTKGKYLKKGETLILRCTLMIKK
jgi:D-hexose-6-phosphate mutarotase